MIHENPAPAFCLATFAGRVVIDGIVAARNDPSEEKWRIMLARQCGFLTDEETEEWIAMAGLRAE